MLTTQGRLESNQDAKLQAGLFDLGVFEFISVGNSLYEVYKIIFFHNIISFIIFY